MTPRDIIPPEFIFFGVIGMCVWLLWRIAALLQAIRDTLADIASATRATAGVIETSKYETDETNRLLKLAIKKQWGSAIDLGED
jgi:hypothetical protein